MHPEPLARASAAALSPEEANPSRPYPGITRQIHSTCGFCMGCQNHGDRKLAEALSLAGRTPTGLNLIVDVLSNQLHKASIEASKDQTSHFVGDVGEVALRTILETSGHQVLLAADRHAARPGRRQALDLVTHHTARIVNEVKTVAHSQRPTHAKKLNFQGIPSLQKPSMSRNVDGSRQGSAQYVAQRLGEAVITSQDQGADGDGQVVVHKIDLRVMRYQSWKVEGSGRVGDPLCPPTDCMDEVAAALLALADRDEKGPEP